MEKPTRKPLPHIDTSTKRFEIEFSSRRLKFFGSLDITAEGEREFMRRHMRIPVSLMLATFVLSLILTMGRAEYTDPIVWPNKKEYDPSETVYLYGYGFKTITQVTITIVRPDLVEDVIQILTDEFGYFSSNYQLNGIHGTYHVTATDGVNVATTIFENCLHLEVNWDDHCCWYIEVEAGGLNTLKSYYVKYFDPAGEERKKSPTYAGVRWFEDEYVILPSLPNILGQWTVKLYEDSTLKKTKCVYVNKMVWTTDSTYNNLVTSFDQGETIYFKTIGLKTGQYYRFMFTTPSGAKIYIGDWTTGVTSLTGSYILPFDAETGSWKLHVREASDSSGTCEHHYVDTCCFKVTKAPPPPQYYLTVQTDPPGITVISGEGWYEYCETVTLTAPELVPGPSEGVQYKFYYWDIDGLPMDEGVNSIEVHMDNNHLATAHYLVQYYLDVIAYPPDVTTPAGSGWYNESENAPIFAPEFVSIVPGESRYRFDGWTTEDMDEINNPSSPSTTVKMDKPKTVTANYAIQYLITFDQTGLDDTAVDTVVTVDDAPKSFSDLPFSMWVDENTPISYTYESIVESTASGKRFILVDVTGPVSPITVTESVTVVGNYRTQYYLAVTSPFGSPTPTSGWFDAGTPITASVTSPWPGPEGTRYICTGWTGTGSIPPSGTGTSVTFTINDPSSITWNWKTQHLLTVLTNPAGLSPQPTRNPLGEPCTPNSWWYDIFTDVTLTAQTVSGYTFDYWDVDGTSKGSGVNPIAVTMNVPHTATAHYTTIPPPSVIISPPSASIRVGQSVIFSSTVSGGTPPYSYQWYLDGDPVAGATSESWTFTPSTPGTYSVHLKVTDKNGNIAESDPAPVIVGAVVPVGGYSISLAKTGSTSQIVSYSTLIAFFGLALIVIRRKRK